LCGVRDIRRLGVLGLLGTAFAVGCGKKSPEPAPVVATRKDDALLGERFPGFRFAPTLDKHKPEGVIIKPLAEVGLPDARRMKAVVATYAASARPDLQIQLWTFDQQGEEDVLAPAGDPTPLLPLAVGQADADSLAELRRDLAAPRTVVGRPQGLAVDSAEAALHRLHDRAKVLADIEADPKARVDALAEFVSGLDDELWLSSKHIPRSIEVFHEGPWVVIGAPDGSKYRTRLRAKAGEGKPEFTLAFLRKRDGWVLQSFEQRR
jgi:hypothetical protein